MRKLTLAMLLLAALALPGQAECLAGYDCTAPCKTPAGCLGSCDCCAGVCRPSCPS